MDWINNGGMAILKDGIDKVQDAFKSMGAWFKENKPKIKSFIDGMGEGFGVVKDAVMKVWDIIKPVFDSIGDALAGLSGEEEGSAGGLGKKIVVLGAAFMGSAFWRQLVCHCQNRLQPCQQRSRLPLLLYQLISQCFQCVLLQCHYHCDLPGLSPFIRRRFSPVPIPRKY